MATVSGVIANEIDNIVNVTDRTAEGTESAARNLDGLQDKADATTRAFEEASSAMGGMASSASGTAADLRRGFDGSATSLLRMSSSVDLVARKLLELQRAQDRLAQAQAQAKAAMADGLSQEDAEGSVASLQAHVAGLENEVAAARKARSAVDDLTQAHKLSGYQMGILADEAHKFADQILAGGSAMTAAFYQAPNAIQTMGGLKNALGLVGAALSGPAGLAVGAGVAGLALYELGAHAEDEQSRLARLSTQLRATRDDAAGMAGSITSASESLRNMPGWNAANARSAATTIGGTYNFTGSSSDIVHLSSIARDAGTVFGSLEDGLKAVQQAMVDPTAEIQALYKQHLPGVDAALVEQVRILQASGEQGKAYALVIGRIADATKGASEQALTPFQRSMEDLHHVLDPITEGIGKLASSIGTDLLNAVTAVISLIPRRSQAATDGLAGSQVLDNYAAGQHHYGLGQVDPRYSYGYDVMTPQGNIDAALKNFMASNRRAGGNWDNTLAYYSGNAIGSAGQHAYNSAVYSYDPDTLPSDTAKLIDQEASRLGLPSRMVNLFKGVIGHESGGHQYKDSSGTTPGAAASVAHATSASVISDQASLLGGSSTDAGGYSSSSYSQQRSEIEAYIASEQKLLAAQTKGSAAWQETGEKIAAARVELANTLSPQEKITQGLRDGLDPLQAQSGYWRSMAEIVAQFGHTARGTGVDQQALAQALTARQQQLAAAYQDGTDAAKRQAQSQSAIADAAGGSAAALQHATNYQQAYTEALQDFDPKSAQFTKAVNDRTAALDASSAAQMRAQQLQQNAGLSDNLTMIQAETAAIGQNADQRSVSLAIMQAELTEHRKYGDVLPQEAQDFISLSGAVAQATADYQHQQAVLSDLTGSLSSMADTISGDITQALIQGAGAGVNFKSALQGIESQVVTMIAKLALINPLLNSIDGGTRNTLDDMFGLLSEGTSTSSSGDVSSSGFSIGQLFNMRRNAASSGDPFGGSGTDVNPNFDAGNDGSEHISVTGIRSSGYSTGQWAGGVLGGVAGGMSIGSMLGGIGGGSGGTIGSLAGTAIGTGAGAALFGPLGAAIGGTVLGGLGGLIGGLFSTSHWAYDDVAGSNGQLSISGSRTKHTSDDVTAGLQTQLDSINDLLDSVGASVDDGSYGSVGHYKKGSKTRSTDLASLLGGIGLTSSDDTFNKALAGGMPSSFDSVGTYGSTLTALKQTADALDNLGVHVTKFDSATKVTVDHIDGYTGDLGTMLAQLDGKSISTDALTSEISTLKGLLDITDSGSESLSSQVDDLTRSYQNAARQAEQYGMDAQVLLDKGAAIAAQMIASETRQLDQSDLSVQARLLSANGDQKGADLLNQKVSGDQEIQQLKDSWESYLGDSYASNVTYQHQMTDLEKTLAAERLQIQAQYNGTSIAQQKEYLSQAQQSVASVYTSLSSYAQGLLTSDASPLSVQDQFDAAKSTLMSDYQAAQGGDYEALSRIQSEMQTELGLGKTLYGSGTDYAQLFQQNTQLLQSLTGADTGALTANLASKLAQQAVDATNNQTTAVTTAIATLQKSVDAMKAAYQQNTRGLAMR
ncbi:phage tail protein [Gluconacetobacter sp. 1b LMG 1731]|uniref:Phage tail protein n=1 Tax=Gluconacetobacter dulcium TaxID=2729096 RepID=A0A7W4IK42_9PROT|nr:phage tail protein [Gluconacetobacter dulcium]MBB2164341.1 phage tail protein [Gluconacetobacter dulcium]MBB2193589.1 phage tail protein [Gluconacetobacter dulcium]